MLWEAQLTFLCARFRTVLPQDECLTPGCGHPSWAHSSTIHSRQCKLPSELCPCGVLKLPEGVPKEAFDAKRYDALEQQIRAKRAS